MFIPLRDDNPTRRTSVVTISLIILNAVVFFVQVFSPQGLQYSVLKMGAIPYEITHLRSLAFTFAGSGDVLQRLFPPLTLVASMFLHGGLFHLIGNMLYLWIFGNNVEDFLGRVRFVFFYLVSGLGASLFHILLNPNSRVPMIGASGAIAGVLGAYMILYPGARVMTLVFIWIVPVPAAIILGLWFVGQLMNVGLGGGVAWLAHIGGFLVGLVIIRSLLLKQRKLLERDALDSQEA